MFNMTSRRKVADLRKIFQKDHTSEVHNSHGPSKEVKSKQVELPVGKSYRPEQVHLDKEIKGSDSLKVTAADLEELKSGSDILSGVNPIKELSGSLSSLSHEQVVDYFPLVR